MTWTRIDVQDPCLRVLPHPLAVSPSLRSASGEGGPGTGFAVVSGLWRRSAHGARLVGAAREGSDEGEKGPRARVRFATATLALIQHEDAISYQLSANSVAPPRGWSRCDPSECVPIRS